MTKPTEAIIWLRALADNVPATSDPSDIRDWKNDVTLLVYIKELEDY